jgi:hypothetical protein
MTTGKGRRWQRVRQLILARQPICPDPFGLHAGRVVPAAEVDHILPHRGQRELFWDASNLWALCCECHAEKTRRERSSLQKSSCGQNLPGKNPLPQGGGAKIGNGMAGPSAGAMGAIARPPCRLRLEARALVRAMAGAEPPPPAAATMPWRALYEVADLMVEAALPRLARQQWLEVSVVPYSAATLRRAQNWRNARISVEEWGDAVAD